LTKEEGRGLRAQVEVFMLETMEERSDSVIELKDESEWIGGGGGVVEGEEAASWLSIWII